jgi:hypothetical protein
MDSFWAIDLLQGEDDLLQGKDTSVLTGKVNPPMRKSK